MFWKVRSVFRWLIDKSAKSTSKQVIDAPFIIAQRVWVSRKCTTFMHYTSRYPPWKCLSGAVYILYALTSWMSQAFRCKYLLCQYTVHTPLRSTTNQNCLPFLKRLLLTWAREPKNECDYERESGSKTKNIENSYLRNVE